MRLQLTKRADYGIRAMLALARARDERMSAPRIAAAMRIPRHFLPQVMADLARAGLVQSPAGRPRRAPRVLRRRPPGVAGTPGRGQPGRRATGRAGLANLERLSVAGDDDGRRGRRRSRRAGTRPRGRGPPPPSTP